MKKIVLITLFMLVAAITKAQEVIKFRTVNTWIRTIDKNGVWSDWISPGEGKDILVTVDTKKQKINVYAADEKEFSSIKLDVDRSGEQKGVVRYINTCIDNKGDKCKVTLIYFNKQSARSLIVDYNAIQLRYDLKSD